MQIGKNKKEVKGMMKDLEKFFRMFKHHEKVLTLNVNELVRENYESASAVFKGFFGEPSWDDNDLLACYKNTDGSFSQTKFDRAAYMIGRLGWRLSAHSSFSKSNVKVCMVPGTLLAEYLSQQAMGITPKNGKDLYRAIQ